MLSRTNCDKNWVGLTHFIDRYANIPVFQNFAQNALNQDVPRGKKTSMRAEKNATPRGWKKKRFHLIKSGDSFLACWWCMIDHASIQFPAAISLVGISASSRELRYCLPDTLCFISPTACATARSTRCPNGWQIFWPSDELCCANPHLNYTLGQEMSGAGFLSAVWMKRFYTKYTTKFCKNYCKLLLAMAKQIWSRLLQITIHTERKCTASIVFI